MLKFRWLFFYFALWTAFTLAGTKECEDKLLLNPPPTQSHKERGSSKGRASRKSRSRIEWRSYESAEAFIQEQGLRGVREFSQWSKSGKRPKDFPANPDRVYNDQWRSWGVFLGTGNIKNDLKEWRSYESAEAFIQEQRLKGAREFSQWSKSGKRPKDFPANPDHVYKDQWRGWGVFLGTGNTNSTLKEWRSYESAEAFIQEQGLKNYKEFSRWSNLGKRPKDFPSRPDRVYKDQWRGWGVFLGTGNIKLKEWMSYESAEAFIQKQGLRSSTEFSQWSKSEKRPKDFPSGPERVYKDQWRGWGVFLGTGNNNYINYKTAKKYVLSLEFEGVADFINWLNSEERPTNFPPRPHEFYSEWVSAADFLSRKETQLPYGEAQQFVQDLGITSPKDFFEEIKLGEIHPPENFPRNPQQAYSKTGEWTGWDDFLGLSKGDKPTSKTNENPMSEPDLEDSLDDYESYSDEHEDY